MVSTTFDYDTGKSYWVWRIYLGIFAFFLISAYTSYNETRYLLFGHKAQAVVTKAHIQNGSGRSANTDYLSVTYTFTDKDGADRTESDTLSPDDVLAQGLASGVPVKVQYISGEPEKSRLAGHNLVWLTIPFVVLTLALAVMTVRFWREYNEFERRKAARQ